VIPRLLTPLALALLATPLLAANPIRVLLWNTERGSNPYGPEGKNRVLQLIRDTKPDLILWQESYQLQDNTQTLAQWTATQLGWNAWQSDSAHLCIVTPFQISKTHTHASFHGVGATLTTPGNQSFIAWSTWIDSKNYLPWHSQDHPTATDAELLAVETSSSSRYKQTQDLLWRIDELDQLDSDLPILIGGDWNCPSHLDWTAATAALHPPPRNRPLPVSRLLESTGFTDAYRSIHPDPVTHTGNTWSPLLEKRENSNLPDPPERIDRLYLKNPPATPGLRPIRATTLPNNWKTATLPRETSTFPSDHAAVLIELEWQNPPSNTTFAPTEARHKNPSPEIDHRPPPTVDPSLTLTRFAFGSCYKPQHPAPALTHTIARKPQLFIALGDNIYGDTEDIPLFTRKYRQLARQPEWRDLTRTCPVIATWDDHDYGADDSGREFPKKAESKTLMLDFFDEPPDSPRRQREGIHTSYLLGPGNQRVQILLLDLRTFRSPLKSAPSTPYPNLGGYQPLTDPDEQTLLGEAQWKWLENELKQPATFRFIGLSTQLAVGFNGYETWANFPKERERFFNLLTSTRAQGVILLSGDTHWAELSLEQRPGLYGIFDLTSSGINQGWPHLGHSDKRCGPGFNRANTGFVEIDWSSPDPAARLSIHDDQGTERIAITLKQSELTFSPPNLTPPSLANLHHTTWQSTFGDITFTRGENGNWTANYGKGSSKLTESGSSLHGTWHEGENTGRCQFTPSRCGRFILGSYSRGDGPLLLSWPCWKNPTHDQNQQSR
jgi:alkaline phosphatase D